MANQVRREPRHDSMSLRDAMDRLFEESIVRPWGSAPSEASSVALDMFQTDDAVVVKASLPGVKPEELSITVTGDMLTIKGETKTENEVKEDNYIRRELRYGSFTRSVPIPVSVQSDKADATFENGVLTLSLPKAEEVKPKAIKVEAKGQ